MQHTVETGYFQGSCQTLYGSRHAARDARQGTVLILSPFGEERKCAYRLIFLLAQQLAGNGFDVLRFDLTGMGESGGNLSTVSLANWTADAQSAMAVLSDSEPCHVIGGRLGANLAVRLPPERLASVVLLEPLLSGADYLGEMMRRKQVKEMMGAGQAASEAADSDSLWAAGKAVDFDGFSVGPQLAEDLNLLSLMDDLEALHAVPLLIQHVTGARKLTGPWANLGSACASNSQWHLELIHEKPFWGRLDYYESAIIPHAVTTFLQNPAAWKGLPDV